MKLGWFSLLFCLGIGIADASARAELVLDTQQVTLSTQRNQAVRKSLRLTTTEEIAQPLQITPSDLELADGSDRIPAQAIAIAYPGTPLSANQTQTLDIQLDGDALQTSGEFTGTLLIQHDDNHQTLPITVRVKAPAGLPWITLLTGAGLGTLLSLYRTVGLPKDELLVRVSKLRTQMRGEKEPAAERFKTQVEGELIAVETALSNRDWKTGEAHLQTAQTVWTRWLSGKPDWIVQIEYLADLLKEVNDSNAYQQSMTAQLKTIQRQLAEQETPQALADLVNPIREQLARYNRGEAWLTKLSHLSAKLKTPEQQSRWDGLSQEREDELGALSPEATDAFNAWLERVKEDCKALSQAIAQQQPNNIAEFDRGSSAEPQPSLLWPMPEVGKRGQKSPPQSAQQNLILFRWVSQAAAITLIAWLGMAEIYEKDTTFGRNPISDYFGLFAWGFGAEVSRDAIVKALGDLKTPLSQKKQEDS